MNWAGLDPPPVGVEVINSLDTSPSGEAASAPIYCGASYCDAVRLAAEGERLVLRPDSIQVCQWSPPVLGLKEPKGRFELGLEPRLPYPQPGLLLAPLDQFPGEPDVVLLGTRPRILLEMLERLGPDQVWDGHEGRLDRSALPTLRWRSHPAGRPLIFRQSVVGAVNRCLATLARSPRWQLLTQQFFRSSAVTAGFEALISRTLADMSVCRNSTAIPMLTGRVNVSFFCTGGITWGRNHPDYLTSGWPYPLFAQATHETSRHLAGKSHG